VLNGESAKDPDGTKDLGFCPNKSLEKGKATFGFFVTYPRRNDLK